MKWSSNRYWNELHKTKKFKIDFIFFFFNCWSRSQYSHINHQFHLEYFPFLLHFTSLFWPQLTISQLKERQMNFGISASQKKASICCRLVCSWWSPFLDLFKLSPSHLTVTTGGERLIWAFGDIFLFSFEASQMDSEILDILLHSSRYVPGWEQGIKRWAAV